MLARYSHIRTGAKQAAIDAVEAARPDAKAADFEDDSPQNPPQSSPDTNERRFEISEKALN